jgi:hypothetical protein
VQQRLPTPTPDDDPSRTASPPTLLSPSGNRVVRRLAHHLSPRPRASGSWSATARPSDDDVRERALALTASSSSLICGLARPRRARLCAADVATTRRLARPSSRARAARDAASQACGPASAAAWRLARHRLARHSASGLASAGSAVARPLVPRAAQGIDGAAARLAAARPVQPQRVDRPQRTRPAARLLARRGATSRRGSPARRGGRSSATAGRMRTTMPARSSPATMFFQQRAPGGWQAAAGGGN